MTEISPLVLPSGKRTALCLNIMYEKWSPGTWPLIGPMGNPLGPGIEDLQALSWSDYGNNAGIWRIREVLATAGVHATIFTSGLLAVDAPESLLAMSSDGHEIAAHGWSQDQIHPKLGGELERKMIYRTRDALSSLTGVAPRGWISPRCTPSDDTARLLSEAGFEWWGDVFDSDRPYRLGWPLDELLAFPFQMELNDLPHRIRYGRSYDELLTLWRWELAAAKELEEPCWIDLTLHAHVSGHPGGLKFLRNLLSEVKSMPEIWVATRSEVLASHRGLTSGGSTGRREQC